MAKLYFNYRERGMRTYLLTAKLADHVLRPAG